ncbi:type II secretion system protein GspM [Paenibacillus sp. YPG26]|uniref:type II secretion system protein GspM n=1 Tax=Paenibacillus sp. YPG26 TaxID=2878915 RepID=UPI00204063EC|nr:type II secretion system protein GspM [Paenibacillus sp. YPG26]USB33686.1 type II secretion system protein GspM [Paenibacillus sp. YPG26]
MMEIVRKYRTVLLPAAVLLFLLLFAFYMLAVQPVVKEAAAQQEEISTLEQDNGLMQNRVNELKGNNEDSPEMAAIREYLPASENTEQLILDFAQINRKAAVILQDVQFTLPESNLIRSSSSKDKSPFPTVREVKMTATLEGNYSQIKLWMSELQKLKRLIAIDSFNFQRPYETQAPGSVIKATVSFTAYYDPS